MGTENLFALKLFQTDNTEIKNFFSCEFDLGIYE